MNTEDEKRVYVHVKEPLDALDKIMSDFRRQVPFHSGLDGVFDMMKLVVLDTVQAVEDGVLKPKDEDEFFWGATHFMTNLTMRMVDGFCSNFERLSPEQKAKMHLLYKHLGMKP